jgi:protein-disulfide isomerase
MSEDTAKVSDTVTINLDAFIMPGAILLSSIIFASTFLIGLNNVASAVKGIQITAGSGTTGTTTGATGAVTVTKDQVLALYDVSNAIRFGDSSKKITLVEFSDPSCPYCHIAAGHNTDLNQQVGGQFLVASQGGTYVPPVIEFKRLVDEGKASYMWFYTNGHGNGEMGAKALYCAQEQGKFWEVHDYLYSAAGYALVNDQIQNDKAKSADLAKALASYANEGQLKDCLESGKYDSKIAEDQAKGTEFGVQGTPGFFVNETSFAGAYSFTEMQSAVDAALAN